MATLVDQISALAASIRDKLNTKASLAAPTFTGVPAAPTATAGTNTTQLATTAFVTTAVSTKANTASPTFTGTPAGPTAAAGTNTTQLASTAFVQTALPPKGVQVFCSGVPASNETIGAGKSPYAFTISATNSSFTSLTAATASTVITIKKNGTQIGTATFAAASKTATMSITTTAVAVGDVLSFHNAATADTALADIFGVLRA